MKKLSIVLASLLTISLLSACESKQTELERKAGGDGYSIVCLKGIEYYKYFGYAGYKGYFGLAPVVDSETLEYKRCSTSTPITNNY